MGTILIIILILLLVGAFPAWALQLELGLRSHRGNRSDPLDRPDPGSYRPILTRFFAPRVKPTATPSGKVEQAGPAESPLARCTGR